MWANITRSSYNVFVVLLQRIINDPVHNFGIKISYYRERERTIVASQLSDNAQPQDKLNLFVHMHVDVRT